MTRPATQYITPTLTVGLFEYVARAISSSYIEGDVLHLLKAREAYRVCSTIFNQPGMRYFDGNWWAARSVLNDRVTFFGGALEEDWPSPLISEMENKPV